MTTTDLVIEERLEERAHKDEPYFHIGDEDATHALCGHKFTNGILRPLVRGPYDCDICWMLYELEMVLDGTEG